ncbi:hypothetical protein Taro_038185, partial [Colocasia esculenta]|nr:hypothetical protein [Colocasia esculenta]
ALACLIRHRKVESGVVDRWVSIALEVNGGRNVELRDSNDDALLDVEFKEGVVEVAEEVVGVEHGGVRDAANDGGGSQGRAMARATIPHYVP